VQWTVGILRYFRAFSKPEQNGPIPGAGLDADSAAAAQGLGHKAALGGLDNGFAFFDGQQTPQVWRHPGAGRGYG